MPYTLAVVWAVVEVDPTVIPLNFVLSLLEFIVKVDPLKIRLLLKVKGWLILIWSDVTYKGALILVEVAPAYKVLIIAWLAVKEDEVEILLAAISAVLISLLLKSIKVDSFEFLRTLEIVVSASIIKSLLIVVLLFSIVLVLEVKFPDIVTFLEVVKTLFKTIPLLSSLIVIELTPLTSNIFLV